MVTRRSPSLDVRTILPPEVGAGETATGRRNAPGAIADGFDSCGRRTALKDSHRETVDARAIGRGQRGQAMVEALIACALVLVPLFLAIPIIAKYMDIKAYTVQAARYAAWERTVWFGGDAAAEMGIGSLTNKWDANAKSDNAIRDEIGARLLSDSGTQAFSSTSNTAGAVRTLWRDRRNTPLLKSYSDNSVAYDNDKAPGLINDVITPLVSIGSVVSSFTLDTKAQYTSKVGIAVKEVAFNVDKGMGGCPSCGADYLATSTALSFADTNVIVANGWSANGPGSYDEYSADKTAGKVMKISVYNQVRGLTPSAALKPESGVFKTVLDIMKTVALVFLPEWSTLDLGRIEVDKVPGDRTP